MSFKNKLFALLPSKYISLKVKDKKEANELIKGYKAIRNKNLFDDDFYLENYPKVKNSKMDPLLHYMFFGFDEGKKPNKDFDGVFYKNYYNDVDINPLVHYALYGEGRLIKPENKDLSSFKGEFKNILFVLHEKIGTVGGTGFLNFDIIKNIKKGYKAFILTSDGVDVELWSVDDRLVKIANYYISFNSNFSIIDNDDNVLEVNDFKRNLVNANLDTIYEEILSKLDIKLVHINHLINHSFNLIDIITKKEIPFLINLHDFYYICPSIHLVDKNCQFCKFECEDCTGILCDDLSKIENIKDKWQSLCLNILKKSYLNIAPTQSVLDIYKDIYPELNNFKIIEHGVEINRSNYKAELLTNPIKILVAGHISPHKGSLLIKKLKEMDKDNKLEFHFLGTTIPNLNKFGVNHGRYERKDFNSYVSKIEPSFSLILSTCPESYSYTLTESWMAGLPVIASDLGALHERINDYGAGWLVDLSDMDLVYNFILNIDNKDYQEKLSNLDEIKFRDISEMSLEYNELYEKIID